MTKNADPDKCFYFGYGIGFDTRRTFSFSSSSRFGKNVIRFGADMSSSVYTDNKKKNMLGLAKSMKIG